jgi:hypothetical protein
MVVVCTSWYNIENCTICQGRAVVPGWLVAHLSQRRPGFVPRLAHARQSGTGDAFLRLVRCFAISIIPRMSVLIGLPPTLYNLSAWHCRYKTLCSANVVFLFCLVYSKNGDYLLYAISLSIFVMETACAFCEVGTYCRNICYVKFSPQ